MNTIEKIRDLFYPTPEFGLRDNPEHENDPRNLLYQDFAPLGAAGERPDEFELELPEMILNQGRIPACVAHAVIHGLGVETGRQASPRHLWWKLKGPESKYPSKLLDYGAYIKDGVDALINEGASDYEFAPNLYTEDTSKYLKLEESFMMLQTEAKNKGGRYTFVTNGMMDNLTKMEEMLRFIWEQKKPVVFGVDWRGSFNAARKGGVIAASMPSGTSNGHAMLATGAKRINGHLYMTCVNSWGPGWGDKGRAYLPQGFARLASGLGVIRGVEIPKPIEMPLVRNKFQEKADAERLKTIIYATFPLNVEASKRKMNEFARGFAFKNWLIICPGVTYKGWTDKDVINYLYSRSRDMVNEKAYNLDFNKVKNA